jgi:hypothetical protein
MKSFKDTAGRTWTLQVNVGTIKRVRDLIGVDLLKVVENNARLLSELADDPIKLADVLYAVIKPEADAARVTDVQFGEAMYGDPIGDGFDSLLEALTDFFPQARQRKALETLMAKFRQTANLILDGAQTQIDAIDPQSAASRTLARLNDTSGAAPANAASTPTA